MTKASQVAEGAPFRILLLDENRIFADVLAMRLREEPQVGDVSVVCSVPEATAILSDLRTDLLLVDYGIGGDLILQLMDELSGLATRPSVLVLSAVQDTRAVVAALESGVRGWVTKDSSFATLWSAVREALLGHMVLSPSVVEPVVVRLLEAIRDEEPSPRRRDFVADLSPREYEVLRCLVAGLSKKEIADRLYLSINTVRTHVQHLLRHADEHTTLALVAAARELGVPGVAAP